jgi:alpha-ketoglutarate-dependent taurine dioxygenase
LDRVRVRTLADFAHQDIPFHKVVEALRPVRDPSRNPLFQVMFILQNAPGLHFDLPGLDVEPVDLAEVSSVFDLSVSLEEDGARGLAGSVRFNTDLFTAATVRRMIERWSLLLRDAVARPDARLDALAAETADERERRLMETTRRKESKFDKLAAARPKAVRLTQEELVRISPLLGEGKPPLLVEPTANGTDGVDLITWGAVHRAQVEEWLARHGGVLFRGFDLGSLSRFQQFVAAVSSGLIKYGERSSPRSALEGEVYTSTDHPEDQPIVLHNEQSYTLDWPMKIAFFCVQPARQGGRTPIADSRRIYVRLSPEVRERFERLGVLYVRNYGDGLGLPWREVFQTGDRAEVERYCREAGLELQWKDGDRLRTRQVRPAIRRHPRTGEPVWFNHALFFHVSSLEPATRDALLAGLAPEDLPFNSFYGDGSPIEPAVLAEIRAAFDAETVSFPWQQGDVLLLDNMLTAHGREPFSGPRRIAVAMADPYAATAGAGGR